MKRFLAASTVVMVILLLVGTWSPAALAGSGVTIRVHGVPKNKPLQLAVGESATFEIHIQSDQPFTLAMAHTDQYWPGRGIFWNGIDKASSGTSAVLYLTMTGKRSTADLTPICDWPQPGYCWPEGVAPVAIAAGVRFPGGVTVGEYFPFAVVVP
jgi:hypothetical protein